MRVAVISPHMHNNGGTTLSMLIALHLADSGKKTCITHINPISFCFYKYLNFIGYQDKTSTPSQIVKILREGSLSGDDVSDYCKQVSDNLEAFTNTASNFTKDDMNFMIQYIANDFPHEHVVFDVDSREINEIQNVIKVSDVVVLNINQSAYELERFKENREEYSKLLDGKPVVVVVNRFNSAKSTLREAANWMGIKKPNNWVVLHENPWIAWAVSHGKLNVLYKQIKLKDKRVIELNSDLNKICNTITKASKEKKRRR